MVDLDVQKPLMPKGVEHNGWLSSPVWIRTVQKPLMPKGVEHTDSHPHWRAVACATTSDAERR
jgi:hypothetical protein